jgi:hypothetical protein
MISWRDIRHLLLISLLVSAGIEFASKGAWAYCVAMFASIVLLQWVRRDMRLSTVVVVDRNFRPRRDIH